jgi:hypothetical protein
VPDGPAAAAGLQQNDILKMLNDQVLVDTGQLAKLVRSFADGTTVTLTVLRKGAEQKIQVKLARHEVHEHGDFGREFMREHRADHDAGMNGEAHRNLIERSMSESFDGRTIRDAIANARREALRQTEEARRQAQRAGEEMRRAARELQMVSRNNGAVRTTRIDLGRAQIVYSDDQGEIRVEQIDGKKVLTAKDRDGKLLFSGPINSREELDKVPADVRQRYEKLEQHDLPAVAPQRASREDANDRAADAEAEDDDSAGDDDESLTGATSLEQVFAGHEIFVAGS